MAIDLADIVRQATSGGDTTTSEKVTIASGKSATTKSGSGKKN